MGKFIAGAKCHQMKAFDGSVMTDEDTIVYADESDGYYQLSVSKPFTKTFDTPEAAIAYLTKCDGMPWYYRLKQGTAFTEDVSSDYSRWPKSKLIARIQELEGSN